MGHLRDIQSGRKVVSVTMQTPQETLLGTPQTLPTSEPATPQVSYTVASGDLPVFSPAVDTKKWVAHVIGAGKAVTAATISFRMKKNGASVNTGNSSVPANNFYTRQCYFYDVAVGDVLEIALWSNQTDSNYDYKAFQIQFTRVLPKSAAPILMPCNITSTVLHPTLSQGVPEVWSTVAYNLYHEDFLNTALTATQACALLYPKATYGIFRLGNGDVYSSNSSTIAVSTTKRPRYAQNRVPVGYLFRILKI